MNTRAEIVRNTLFSSVGIYTEYFLGMLTSIIIARELMPSGYGSYSLVIWLAAVGIAVTNSGTATAAIKFVAELRGRGHEDMIPALLKYLRRAEHGFFVVVLAIGALVFWHSGASLTHGLDHWLVFGLLAVAVALRAPYMFDIGVAKGFEDFRATATVAAVATPVNLALVVLAWLLHWPVMGFLLVYLTSSIVFHFVARMQVNKRVKPLGAGVPLPPELLQRVRRHMRIVAVTVTVSFISAREVEVLFLSLYDSSAAAGQFKAAYQLASGAALLVPGVFGAVLLPMMANAISQGAKLAAWRFSTSTAYLVTLAAPLVVFGALFSHAVIALLYGRMYADAAPVLAVLMFACCFGALSSGASSLLVSADRQQHMLILTLVFGVLKVALDWLLIAHYGLMGAMAASAILAVSGSTATLLLALHVSGAGLPWSRLGRTLLAAVLAGLAAWPLRHLLPPLPTLLLGGLAIGLVYALATLLLRCWSRGDLEYMQSVIARMGRIAPAWLGRLLGWAAVRAGEEAT